MPRCASTRRRSSRQAQKVLPALSAAVHRNVPLQHGKAPSISDPSELPAYLPWS